MRSLMKLLFIIISVTCTVNCQQECFKLKTSITQKIEQEGFHRDIWWLLETADVSKETWIQSKCNLALKLEISNSMFVNPDELAELNRMGELRGYIEGKIDVEAPAHEATHHTVYMFLNNSEIDRMTITLPIHLRYQRGQITGGYGKAPLRKPSLLVWCPDSLNIICGKGLKVEAPCDEKANSVCIWKNLTYYAHFDDLELFVPVGDLDDYPLVSIVTLLLGCAGCIYILSVLSTTPL